MFIMEETTMTQKRDKGYNKEEGTTQALCHHNKMSKYGSDNEKIAGMCVFIHYA